MLFAQNEDCKHPPPKTSADGSDPIIDNGSLVQLGINPEGNLNVPGGTPSFQNGTTFVGLRFIPTNGDATAPGCLCEGWGVANADTSTGEFATFADISADGGAVNMTVQPGTMVTNATGQIKPESVGSAFRSIVRDGSGRVEVTHDYNPSAISSNLYEVTVTIDNIGTVAIGDLRYRRVMDWDIPPTTFNEWVKIHVGTASGLLRATTDGFQSANPLSSPGPDVGVPPTTLTPGSPDYFSGPTDQGALFDFILGRLDPGKRVRIVIFYGGAVNEAQALAALATVGAEVYSLGYPTTEAGGPSIDGPNVFIFGFKGVSGADVSITKTGTPGTLRVGQILTYTATVRNNGPSDASDVTVTDKLPTGVHFVSASSSQGSCTVSGGVVTCNLGTLANGASANVTIMVSPTTPGRKTNTAQVSTTTFNDDPANNTASVTTRVLPARK